MPNVLIPKEYERKRSLVAIPKRDYLAYMTQRGELRDALAKIARSRAEVLAGTIQVVQSLRELR